MTHDQVIDSLMEFVTDRINQFCDEINPEAFESAEQMRNTFMHWLERQK